MKISRKFYIVVFTLIACFLYALPSYAQTTEIYCAVSPEVPLFIEDGSTEESSITVPNSGEITDVNVKLFMQTNVRFRLDPVTLTSADSTQITLFAGVGGGAGDFGNSCDDNGMPNFILDDSGADGPVTGFTAGGGFGDGNPVGTFVPQDPLSTFNTEEQMGIWTLSIQNIAVRFDADLLCWCLEITREDVIPSIVLSPPLATNVVGTDHTVTATVEINEVPEPDVLVTFEVISGPNAGEMSDPDSGECTPNDDCNTDANGEVSWTYTGSKIGGSDTIVASFFDESTEMVIDSNTVEKIWEFLPIPTPSEWGLIALAGILGIVGFMVIRRRKVTA